MFIDRFEVHNNTMIKHTALITHIPHIYSITVILKYVNINLKENSINPNTYIQIF